LDEAQPSPADIESGEALDKGEVVVEIRSTGICGSDVHFWDAGRIGPMIVQCRFLNSPRLPRNLKTLLLQIVDVHPSLMQLKLGDRVPIEPVIPCHTCAPCLRGRYNGCERVFFRSTPSVPGLLRRYITHPAVWCHKLPPSLSYEDGALLEPLSVALATVERRTAFVCGRGRSDSRRCSAPTRQVPIRSSSLTTIRGDSISQSRFSRPRMRPLRVAPDNSPDALAAWVVEAMGGTEPDVALECTGAEASICAAIHAVRFRGTVFVVGVGKNKMQFPFMGL
ncbi:chaperonin 10-like protein, partial [Lactarius quietus]